MEYRFERLENNSASINQIKDDNNSDSESDTINYVYHEEIVFSSLEKQINSALAKALETVNDLKLIKQKIELLKTKNIDNI